MFRLTYHRKVADDLSAIATFHRRAIRKAIEEKLTVSPEFFGKPLHFSLRGLRSLRIGDYRVVFQIQKAEVFIIFIAHRSMVYTLVDKQI